ncbi:MAG TPA: hypothetical protein VNB49_10075, partial [Candidatus Dormibacteraeota bacterium]|nr:hypothetical protein [Candidatus Dormibacteraeota bacterium]
MSKARPSGTPAHARGRNRDAFFPVFLSSLFALCLAGPGCKKAQHERLTPARIHSITRELSEAAHSAAPSGTQIHVGIEASEKSFGATDRLEITLPKSQADSLARSEAAKIQQALRKVATRHELTAEPSESR